MSKVKNLVKNPPILRNDAENKVLKEVLGISNLINQHARWRTHFAYSQQDDKRRKTCFGLVRNQALLKHVMPITHLF